MTQAAYVLDMPTARAKAQSATRGSSQVKIHRTYLTKTAAFSYDQLAMLAMKNPPPQSWFEADFSRLRGPQKKPK